MNKSKETKAITLIALIITVIIMLILAMVAISVLTSEDGLFSKVKESADLYEDSTQREKEAYDSILGFFDEYQYPIGIEDQSEELKRKLNDFFDSLNNELGGWEEVQYENGSCTTSKGTYNAFAQTYTFLDGTFTKFIGYDDSSNLDEFYIYNRQIYTCSYDNSWNNIEVVKLSETNINLNLPGIYQVEGKQALVINNGLVTMCKYSYTDYSNNIKNAFIFFIGLGEDFCTDENGNILEDGMYLMDREIIIVNHGKIIKMFDFGVSWSKVWLYNHYAPDSTVEYDIIRLKNSQGVLLLDGPENHWYLFNRNLEIQDINKEYFVTISSGVSYHLKSDGSYELVEGVEEI